MKIFFGTKPSLLLAQAKVFFRSFHFYCLFPKFMFSLPFRFGNFVSQKICQNVVIYLLWFFFISTDSLMFVVFLCDLKQFVNLTRNKMHVPMTMLLFFEKKKMYMMNYRLIHDSIKSISFVTSMLKVFKSHESIVLRQESGKLQTKTSLQRWWYSISGKAIELLALP